MKRQLALTLLLLFTLGIVSTFCSPALQAQTPLFFDELGAGARATAMGQAFTALADDSSATYYNPAGLTQASSFVNLTLGYQYAKPRIKVKFDTEPIMNPLLGRSEFSQVEDLSSRGLYLGFSSNLDKLSAVRVPPILDRFALGLVLFANLPEVLQFDNPQRPQDPYVFKYNERWSLLSVAISLGFRCTDWLSVGVGVMPTVNSLQSTPGTWISVNGIIDPNDPGRGGRMDLRQKSTLNIAPIGGILIHPPLGLLKDKLSVGLCYRGKMWGYYGTGLMRVDIAIERGRDPIIIPFQQGRSVDYIGFTPEQITGGVALRALPGLTVALDLTWKRYSEFHFFWDLLPFVLDPETRARVDCPFNDVWVPRLGLCYAFDPGLEGKYLKRLYEISLLAGYYREPTPVPDKNVNDTMNMLDADQNVVSGGIGLKYNPEWVDHIMVQAFFQAHLLEKNYIENDRDSLFGPITVSGQVYNAGISVCLVY